MKRNFFLLNVIIITVSLLCSGSLYADKPKVKGYYVNKNGDKMEVLMEIFTQPFSKKINEAKFQNGFEYYDKKGKSVKVTSKEAEEFGLIYMGEEYVFRYVPLKPNANVVGVIPEGLFCRLLIDGPCTLLAAKIYKQTAGGYSFDDEFVLYKNKTDVYLTQMGLRMIPYSTNKLSMQEFFADCPELTAKMKNKEFKKGDDRYHRLVTCYNTACGEAGANQVEEEDLGE